MGTTGDPSFIHMPGEMKTRLNAHGMRITWADGEACIQISLLLSLVLHKGIWNLPWCSKCMRKDMDSSDRVWTSSWSSNSELAAYSGRTEAWLEERHHQTCQFWIWGSAWAKGWSAKLFSSKKACLLLWVLKPSRVIVNVQTHLQEIIVMSLLRLCHNTNCQNRLKILDQQLFLV